jgi:hypothetical protein
MGTKPEISQRYPKNIELDEGQGQAGPSFLRARPGGQPQVRPVSLRLMGATDKAATLQFAYSLPKEDLLFLRSDIMRGRCAGPTTSCWVPLSRIEPLELQAVTVLVGCALDPAGVPGPRRHL